tara:strand:- start:7 stop:666 length:660 start_codon:yes stop_codon:yes gene_type:complete
MRYRIDSFNNGVTITQGLIAVNVIIFLYMNFAGADFMKEVFNKFCCSGIIPFDWNNLRQGAQSIFQSGEYYRFLTANFLHRDILHLFMNMMALYYLGRVAEYMLGKRNFIIIYFICAIGSTLLSALANIWTDPYTIQSLIGASGAVLGIAGCLAGIAIYRKINNIYYGIQINYQPLIMILGLNVVIGLVPGISFMGHLAGALTGLVSGFVYALLIEKNN